MSGTTGISRSSRIASAANVVGPFALDDEIGVDGGGVVLGEDVSDSGRDEDVDVQFEQLVVRESRDVGPPHSG